MIEKIEETGKTEEIKFPEVERRFADISTILLMRNIRKLIENSEIPGGLRRIATIACLKFERLQDLILNANNITFDELNLLAQFFRLNMVDIMPSIDTEKRMIISRLGDFGFKYDDIATIIEEYPIEDFVRLFKCLNNLENQIEILQEENERLTAKTIEDAETIRKLEETVQKLEKSINSLLEKYKEDGQTMSDLVGTRIDKGDGSQNSSGG